MAYQIIKNIDIKGIAACVPTSTEYNQELDIFSRGEEAERFIEVTGVNSRHLVKNSGLCSSDLCYTAAVQLMAELQWSPDDVDCLIFVSQTPDYLLPATSCILQDRLGINQDCYALDISLGCSGWIYGLSVIASLISGGIMKKGLLLVGDTTSVTKSHKDKSAYPLFGDAGTATAIEYSENGNEMVFNFGTDGKGYEAIIIPDGGFRNFFNERTLIEKENDPGIFRHKLHTILNGPAVFTFSITKAPRSVNSVLSQFKISKEEIDYYIFHQANLFMNEKIRTKLNLQPEKVPYSLYEFGNTSSASIPLTIVTKLATDLSHEKKKILACAFGVGFSWASVVFVVSGLKCPAITEI
jgi:3-oxoacyl-[acyl-carrier-protein] synthase-3